MADKAESSGSRISRLRQELESMGEVRVPRPVADITAKAQETLGGVSGTARDQIEFLSSQIKQRPFVAMLVAVGLGWLLSRVVR